MLCLLGAARRAWEGETHAARRPLAAGQHDRAARARPARQGAGHRRHGSDRAGGGATCARFRPGRPLSQPDGIARRQGGRCHLSPDTRGPAAALPLPVAELPRWCRDPTSDQRADPRPSSARGSPGQHGPWHAGRRRGVDRGPALRAAVRRGPGRVRGRAQHPSRLPRPAQLLSPAAFRQRHGRDPRRDGLSRPGQSGCLLRRTRPSRTP